MKNSVVPTTPPLKACSKMIFKMLPIAPENLSPLTPASLHILTWSPQLPAEIETFTFLSDLLLWLEDISLNPLLSWFSKCRKATHVSHGFNVEPNVPKKRWSASYAAMVSYLRYFTGSTPWAFSLGSTCRLPRMFGTAVFQSLCLSWVVQTMWDVRLHGAKPWGLQEMSWQVNSESAATNVTNLLYEGPGCEDSPFSLMGQHFAEVTAVVVERPATVTRTTTSLQP